MRLAGMPCWSICLEGFAQHAVAAGGRPGNKSACDGKLKRSVAGTPHEPTSPNSKSVATSTGRESLESRTAAKLSEKAKWAKPYRGTCPFGGVDKGQQGPEREDWAEEQCCGPSS